MMKHLNKIISVLCVLTLIIGMMPSAFAASPKKYNGYSVMQWSNEGEYGDSTEYYMFYNLPQLIYL